MTRYDYKDNPSGASLTWPRFTLLVFWDVRGRHCWGCSATGRSTAVHGGGGAGGVPGAGRTRRSGVCTLRGRSRRIRYRQARGLLTLSWHGSLLQEKREAGLIYQRNRLYDPKSGRFTQEDPIMRPAASTSMATPTAIPSTSTRLGCARRTRKA
ncbi:MAG: hypothetical protein IPK85_24215 [Gemmatimonadetes bacterium]|nr:hypothetical protein [Gemmatimonadota bacterium]